MSDTSLTVGETATATFTFSEAPVGFSLADVSATGGTLSSFTQVDATHYTVTFTPTAGINISNAKVSVTASSYTDAAGNAGAAGASANFAVNTVAADTTAPTVSVSMSDTSLTVGETATATLTFSEAPVGFIAGRCLGDRRHAEQLHPGRCHPLHGEVHADQRHQHLERQGQRHGIELYRCRRQYRRRRRQRQLCGQHYPGRHDTTDSIGVRCPTRS